MTQPDPSTEPSEEGRAFAELVSVMRRLLGPGGCPWDREQTLASLRPYLLEETCEVLDALDAGDPAAHREELGDLLMQIVFQAELRSAEGAFSLAEVPRAIADKLVRRHPHVFAGGAAQSPEEVERQWEEIKAEEKRSADQDSRPSALSGVPSALPALARAQKISRRAAGVGFDWDTADGSRRKVDEELAEIEHARAHEDPQAVEAEVGDALYALVSYARKLGVDAELALRGATSRFERRFESMEAELAGQGRAPSDMSVAELERYWQRAKARAAERANAANEPSSGR